MHLGFLKAVMTSADSIAAVQAYYSEADPAR